jgi:excinuclease ABC subunit B
MAKPPKKPKDPAKPTRAKAARPIEPPTPDALADLLNPAINKGTAGLGSGTGPQQPTPSFRGAGKAREPGMADKSGLQPPPDNSWDRRRDFSAAHTARKSATKGFEEARQTAFEAPPVSGLDPRLAEELGLSDEAKYRLPKADLPTQPTGFTALASQQSLEKLLREGRKEFAEVAGGGKVWTPHRPPRPEKS